MQARCLITVDRYSTHFAFHIDQLLSLSLTNAKFAIPLAGRDTGSKRISFAFEGLAATSLLTSRFQT